MFNLRKIINGRMNVPEMELLPVTASESFVMGLSLIHISEPTRLE